MREPMNQGFGEHLTMINQTGKQANGVFNIMLVCMYSGQESIEKILVFWPHLCKNDANELYTHLHLLTPAPKRQPAINK